MNVQQFCDEFTSYVDSIHAAVCRGDLDAVIHADSRLTNQDWQRFIKAPNTRLADRIELLRQQRDRLVKAASVCKPTREWMKLMGETVSLVRQIRMMQWRIG